MIPQKLTSRGGFSGEEYNAGVYFLPFRWSHSFQSQVTLCSRALKKGFLGWSYNPYMDNPEDVQGLTLNVI